MPLLYLALALGGLLLIFWLAAPRRVPWADDLTRLRAGVAGQAEWVAPLAVRRQVQRDYLATQHWLNDTALQWGLQARELPHYTSGPYLQWQQRALAQLMRQPGPRFAATLAADHHLVVRHFASDGAQCLLIDQQTQRHLTTRAYWSGQVAHHQALEPTTLVWQMAYDMREKRWKIQRLVQRWPPPVPRTLPVKWATRLPTHMGRDY